MKKMHKLAVVAALVVSSAPLLPVRTASANQWWGGDRGWYDRDPWYGGRPGYWGWGGPGYWGGGPGYWGGGPWGWGGYPGYYGYGYPYGAAAQSSSKKATPAPKLPE